MVTPCFQLVYCHLGAVNIFDRELLIELDDSYFHPKFRQRNWIIDRLKYLISQPDKPELSIYSIVQKLIPYFQVLIQAPSA